MKHQGTKVTILIIYVKDLVVTGNVVGEITRLKDQLTQEFEIKDLGPLKYFRGIEVAKSNKKNFFIPKEVCPRSVVTVTVTD